MSQTLHIPTHRAVRLAALSLTTIIVTFVASTAHAGSTGRCGGTGGKFSKTITCPSGEYIVGLGERRGMFVDSISAACRKIPVKGSPEPLGPRQSFQTAGASGGTSSISGSCPDGQAVRSVLINSGGFVDDLVRGSCAARTQDGWGNSVPAVIDLRADLGGGGGCRVTCPDGEALYKLTVKYDGWVDSVRGECRR